jgi:hypothetical protein
LEIHRPDDWAALVTAHPDDSRTGNYEGWEVNGGNHGIGGRLTDLLAVTAQRAARTGVRRFVEPDWPSVAKEWDGVHLSWAGFLTTEGTVCDLGEGEIAMLRGWGSERTLWLNPVLRDPHSIQPDSTVHPNDQRRDSCSMREADRHRDTRRIDGDLKLLQAMLGLPAD